MDELPVANCSFAYTTGSFVCAAEYLLPHQPPGRFLFGCSHITGVARRVECGQLGHCGSVQRGPSAFVSAVVFKPSATQASGVVFDGGDVLRGSGGERGGDERMVYIGLYAGIVVLSFDTHVCGAVGVAGPLFAPGRVLLVPRVPEHGMDRYTAFQPDPGSFRVHTERQPTELPSRGFGADVSQACTVWGIHHAPARPPQTDVTIV